MDNSKRNQLIKKAEEARDRLAQQNRDKQDRAMALHDDLSDAYTDYHRGERDQDALRMSKAQSRIEEVKKQIDEMNNE